MIHPYNPLIVCEGRLDQEYGHRILEVLLNCCNPSTPIDVKICVLS